MGHLVDTFRLMCSARFGQLKNSETGLQGLRKGLNEIQGGGTVLAELRQAARWPDVHYKPVASSNHPLNRTCVGWSLEISFNDAGTDAENDPAAIKQANGGTPLTDLYNGYRKIGRILGHQTTPPSLRALQQRNLPLATLYYPRATACTAYWVCNCS
jgi:hypothetical protein